MGQKWPFFGGPGSRGGTLDVSLYVDPPGGPPQGPKMPAFGPDPGADWAVFAGSGHSRRRWQPRLPVTPLSGYSAMTSHCGPSSL